MSPSAPPVLVTGASGFLGGYVVRELRAQGVAVLASGRNAAALGRVAAPEEQVVSSLAPCPCAVRWTPSCTAPPCSLGPPPRVRGRELDGTRAALAFAERNGARRFVFVSSPSVYAAPRDRIGIREEDVDPGNRLNEYIRSKIAAERLLQQALREGRIPDSSSCARAASPGPGIRVSSLVSSTCIGGSASRCSTAAGTSSTSRRSRTSRSRCASR